MVEMRKAFARFAALAAAVPIGAGMLAACAAPVVPVDNVVIDADVLDCSREIFENVGPLDVAIAIDTSQSTRRPTGFDIDGDGSIGVLQRSTSSDRDDSRLSAQVAALRLLLRNAAGRDIRFSLITFSGPSISPTSRQLQRFVAKRDAVIRAELTSDVTILESVLDEVLERGSGGTTNFYAGMQRANISLIESEVSKRTRRRLVLFMSESPRPTLLGVDGSFKERDPRMKYAARVGIRHKIVFNTFGVSQDSGSWRRQLLGRIAGATGGTYHVVEDPLQLYCHLAISLVPPHQRGVRRRAFAGSSKGPAPASGDGELAVVELVGRTGGDD